MWNCSNFHAQLSRGWQKAGALPLAGFNTRSPVWGKGGLEDQRYSWRRRHGKYILWTPGSQSHLLHLSQSYSSSTARWLWVDGERYSFHQKQWLHRAGLYFCVRRNIIGSWSATVSKHTSGVFKYCSVIWSCCLNTRQCFSNLQMSSLCEPMRTVVLDSRSWLTGVQPDMVFGKKITIAFLLAWTSLFSSDHSHQQGVSVWMFFVFRTILCKL